MVAIIGAKQLYIKSFDKSALSNRPALKYKSPWKILKKPAFMDWPEPPDYGIVSFFAYHEHRCALCGRERLDLVVDHDYETNLVRGLLCQPCNIAEGQHKEAKIFLWWARYNPAFHFQISIPYSGTLGQKYSYAGLYLAS